MALVLRGYKQVFFYSNHISQNHDIAVFSEIFLHMHCQKNCTFLEELWFYIHKDLPTHVPFSALTSKVAKSLHSVFYTS